MFSGTHGRRTRRENTHVRAVPPMDEGGNDGYMTSAAKVYNAFKGNITWQVDSRDFFFSVIVNSNSSPSSGPFHSFQGSTQLSPRACLTFWDRGLDLYCRTASTVVEQSQPSRLIATHILTLTTTGIRYIQEINIKLDTFGGIRIRIFPAPNGVRCTTDTTGAWGLSR